METTRKFSKVHDSTAKRSQDTRSCRDNNKTFKHISKSYTRLNIAISKPKTQAEYNTTHKWDTVVMYLAIEEFKKTLKNSMGTARRNVSKSVLCNKLLQAPMMRKIGSRKWQKQLITNSASYWKISILHMRSGRGDFKDARFKHWEWWDWTIT